MQIPLIKFGIGGIYAIKNNVTGKIYIGSSKNLRQRLSRHRSNLKYKKHSNEHLQSSCEKYGIDNFELIILETVDDLDQLVIREQFYIDFYNSGNREFGYNKIIDAVRGTLSAESLKKISEKSKGRKCTPETAKRISEAKKGRKWTPEFREKMKTSLPRGINHHGYGKPLSQEIKNKISTTNKGRIMSQENKDKISLALKGKRSNLKPIIQLSLSDGSWTRYECIVDAAKIYGNKDTIRYALVNSTVAYHFLWKYASSEIVKKERRKGIPREKLSYTKPVIKVSLDDEIICRYESIVDASKEHGSKHKLYKACKSGKNQFGFKWMYASTPLNINESPI